MKSKENIQNFWENRFIEFSQEKIRKHNEL